MAGFLVAFARAVVVERFLDPLFLDGPRLAGVLAAVVGAAAEVGPSSPSSCSDDPSSAGVGVRAADAGAADEEGSSSPPSCSRSGPATVPPLV
jgi:hypothetical protein